MFYKHLLLFCRSIIFVLEICYSSCGGLFMHRANDFGGGFNPLMQCNPHVYFAIFSSPGTNVLGEVLSYPRRRHCRRRRRRRRRRRCRRRQFQVKVFFY